MLMEKGIYTQDGIYLRLMREEDTEDIVRWRNSDAVRQRFIYRGIFTEETHRNWIRTMVEPGKVVQAMICESATDKAVGSVYIRDIDRTHSKGEYGIFIGEDSARGRGIGTAAARLMIRYAFEELGLHRLFLRVLADNVQAISSYEKAGFQREAYLREDVFLDGKYQDVILMAIINKR
ncbi:MAG: GNAT family N-acetyltransferase [Lachnospiraceae bacterium]|nr:GNAT family N-acetyltransferase [Lachnospiraceae bacterium]